MKIRIKGNSLRYRLTKSEVTRLNSDGVLSEHTSFAGKTLIYSIETTSDNMLSADFVNNSIILKMPQAMIAALANSDKVGFEERSGPVLLLVEKDFVCIDNTMEDQSDNYPNPSLACS